MAGPLLHLGLFKPDLSRVSFADDGSVLGQVIGSDFLLLTSLILFVLCAAALWVTIKARRETVHAQKLATRRAFRLAQIMRTVELAERIAGLGVWQYEPFTGEQEWSNGLREIFGVRHSEPFMEGDAETLLFANDIDLVGAVRNRLAERCNYNLEFDLFGFDGCPRAIAMQLSNLRGRDGNVHQVVAVVRDVTEEKSRVRELKFSRAAAIRDASKARKLAETDALTGLANRRKVMDELDRQIMRVRNNERPLVLLVFDIDHFKNVNDTYGHSVGDEVLKRVANIAAEHARDGDLIGRIGGEEFVWIIPGGIEMSGRQMSERLRQAIESESAVEGVSPVTISIGLAELLPGETSLSLLARADKALYAAKHAGRNQVRLAA